MNKAMELPATSALLTDFYQLTMLDAYYQLGMTQKAVFEFYVRRLPRARNFLVAAGLEQVLDYLESLRFTSDEIAWLASLNRFSPQFLERLAGFKFTGDVFAMREGTVFFANEPVLRVEARLPEAQMIESRLINLLQYQTMIASKAARCRVVAADEKIIDFGMRRSHGGEAALLSARATYVAGFDATATVAAARAFDMPVVGTMAHSFVQAHEHELEAFRNFSAAHPNNVVLLIDTYDTDRGARRAASIATELQRSGGKLQAVRIDSGDLVVEAGRVRAILDAEHCSDVDIYVSGNLDEYEISRLRAAGAPIDAYCVGTHITVSEDAPSLDCVYKLHEYAGRPTRKRAVGKESWPGARQVFRQFDAHGRLCRDVIACADEVMEGMPLLQEVMVHGHRKAPSPAMRDVRSFCLDQLAKVPVELRTLDHFAHGPTKVSARQRELMERMDQRPS